MLLLIYYGYNALPIYYTSVIEKDIYFIYTSFGHTC